MHSIFSPAAVILGVVLTGSGAFAQRERITAKQRSGQLDETVWRLAKAAHVPIGLERLDGVAQKSGIAFTGDIEKDLDALVAQLDGFRWEKLAGVYVVRPTSAWTDSTDPLNQRTHAVNWQDIEIERASDHIANLFYPNTALGQRPDSKTRRFSVTVEGGTFVHVLNAVAREQGNLVWIAQLIPPSSSPNRFGVELRDFDGDRAGFRGVIPKPLPSER